MLAAVPSAAEEDGPGPLPEIAVLHVTLHRNPRSPLTAIVSIRIGEVLITGARLLRAPDCPGGLTLAPPLTAHRRAKVRFLGRLRAAVTVEAIRAVSARRAALVDRGVWPVEAAR